MSEFKPRLLKEIACSRIVIELPLRTMGYPNESTDRLRQDAHDVIAQIKRHVDLPFHTNGPTWEPEWETGCVHCRRDPEPNEHGWPACCDEAMQDAEAAGLTQPDGVW